MVAPARRDAAKRATLTAVAHAAGVSTATASKVLNHRPDVAPDTRRRVEAAFTDLGYQGTGRPAWLARPPVVTVVFDSLVNSYSTQVLRGVLSAARDLGVEIVVEVINEVGSDPGPALSPPWIRSVSARGVLGVLVVATEVTSRQTRAFAEAGLQLVAIDPTHISDDAVVSVSSTNFTGGLQATDHLLELGHRRIAHAAGPGTFSAARERVHGYLSALETAGVGVEDSLVVHGGFDYDSGVEMAVSLLGLEEPPTAIFAGCDASALGVLEGARRAGLRVPEDLSVVGFDDTPMALWSAPPLTTVRQPMTGFGRVAMRCLLQLADGEQPFSHHIQLATSLVRRESSAVPPRACDVEPSPPMRSHP